MALVQSTLASGIEAIVPTLDVAVAASAWADAYASYALGASALSPILAPAVDIAKPLMIPALLGMAAPGAAALAIQGGIVAFWASVASTPALAFAAAILVTPPVGIATVGAGLLGAFAGIQAAQKTLSEAAADIAAVIHIATVTGGTVTTPALVPIVTPII